MKMFNKKETVVLLATAVVVATVNTALGLDISTPEDYKNFVTTVNAGNDYFGQTVFLKNDLDLGSLGTVDPIGESADKPFMGVFDGQGHIISNMKMNSSTYRIGMFGSTDNGVDKGGVTVKNVILDSSCSLQGTKMNMSEWTFVSGIMASCSGYTSECRIEGCVNMADITFTGTYLNASGVSIGSMISGCSGVNFSCAVENSVNYGTITFNSDSKVTYFGGIVGYFINPGSALSYAKSCVNYGNLVNNGTSRNGLFVAGIAGFTSGNNYVQNCVNFGTYDKGPHTGNTLLGGTVGRTYDVINATNCYWRNDVWNTCLGGPGNPCTYSVENSTGFNKSTLALDDGTSLYDALKTNGATSMYKITFNLNGGSINSKITNPLITPTLNNVLDPVKGNTVFCGWCTDSTLKRYADFSTTNPGELTLYAKWYHTISFVVDSGETIQPIDSGVGGVVTLPKASHKQGHTFAGWKSSVDNNVYGGGSQFTMPNSEVTFTAQFSINEYRLTFYNWDGGLVKDDTKVKFGSLVDSSNFPEQTPMKEGHTFAGWDMTGDDNELINEYKNSGSFAMPSHNVSFTARFEINEYTLSFYNWDGSLIENNNKAKFNITINSSYFPEQTPMKEGHTFAGWDMTEDDNELINEYKNSGSFAMPSHNVSFTARFEINEYALSFFNWDGSLVEGDVRIEFNSIVNSSYFPEQDPTKEGFIFDGWIMTGDDSELIDQYENDGKFTMPNKDVTFTVSFISDTIQIVFGTVVLEEDIKEELKKYTDKSEYIIVRIDDNGGKTTVIIKFNDAEDAKSFSRDLERSNVQVAYVTVEEGSLSHAVAPAFFIFNLF